MKIRYLILLFASGLSKGYSYLMAPLIYTLFGEILLGQYILITTLSLIISQLISLNPTSVIIRNSNDSSLCTEYTFYYYLFSLIIFTISIFILTIFNFNDVIDFVLTIIVLASAEGLFSIAVAYFRGNDFYVRFLLITLLKSLFIAIYVYNADSNINNIILFTSLLIFSCSFFFIFNDFWMNRYELKSCLSKFNYKKLSNDLFFGIKLIPHSFGLWGFTSATKVILKITSGTISLGLFTIYITFSFPLVIANSALTLLLPREIVKNPILFVKNKKDFLFFKFYTLFVSFCLFIIFIFCYLDNSLNFYIDSYTNSSIISILLCTLIFYNFGVYQFLANYLFFYKQSAVLSKNTIFCSFTSVLLSILLSYFFGIVGAVIALYIASFFYVFITYVSVNKISGDDNTILIWKSYCLYSLLLLLFVIFLGVLSTD